MGVRLKLVVVYTGRGLSEFLIFFADVINEWPQAQTYEYLNFNFLTNIKANINNCLWLLFFAAVIQPIFNPFSTHVPLMGKPGSWFLLAKCLKSTCGRVTF